MLNPASTKDLYFVADGKGGHVFAETLKDHNANVQKYRAFEREKAKAAAEAQNEKSNEKSKGAGEAPWTSTTEPGKSKK